MRVSELVWDFTPNELEHAVTRSSVSVYLPLHDLNTGFIEEGSSSR